MKTYKWLGIPILMTALSGFLPLSAYAASPQVVTVPWRGALNLPHETYNGKAIHLKGIAKNVVLPATATWTPGDGSPAQSIAVAAGINYGLELIHTYPNSSAGTPYTATLTVCNGADCNSAQYNVVIKNRTLNTEINIAIDEALWFTHKSQNKANGDWTHNGYYGGYGDVSHAAASIQSFQINNHFETGNPNLDPYAETVKAGLQFLFTRMATTALPNPPTVGRDPELGQAAPNRLAILLPNSPRQPYELGSVMDAIVSSKTPNAVAATGPAGIVGRTYKELVQDMVDMYAYGQYNDINYGGWRYNWGDFPDNSACQWAAIGILAARDLWGCTVPQWVIDRNLNWLWYSRAGTPAYGYGYTGGGEGDALSPSGLVQLIMDGIPKTNADRWVEVENRLASLWNSWYRDSTNYYALFALAKAMRLALPDPIVQMAAGTANQIDWFGADCANPAACTGSEKWGLARTLIRDQNAASGAFEGEGLYFSGAATLPHAWATIILTGTLEVPPVAIAKAHPNPAANGQTIYFEGTDSYHPDPSKTIVKYEWDFDSNGTADATGTTTSFVFPNCASLPCEYPVSLKVTDNSTPTPLIGSDTIKIRITVPPHPPTANAGGPYWVCTNKTLQLDGSKSYDSDASYGDSITAWNWELNMVAPYDFLEAAGASPAFVWTYGNGIKNIGLRVTDNSAVIFPGLGPNLTDDNFTTVNAWDCSCFGTLVARAKPGKIDLTWPPVSGAASYDIYRSTAGPNSGFIRIAANHVTTYAAYADTGLANGTTYYYRVAPNAAIGAQVCGGSNASSAKPMAR
jgi:PKD domain